MPYQNQFETELNRIQNDDIRKYVEFALSKVPEYFWTKPSSSTSKYHPPQSNVVGGLVNHTKSVCHFAEVLIRAYKQEPYMLKSRKRDMNAISDSDCDHIRAACICHDLLKYGLDPAGQRYTTKDHDMTSATFVKETAREFGLDEHDMRAIAFPVMYHMSQWSSKLVPEKTLDQLTTTELIVHLADMISADKAVTLDFLPQV